VWLLRGGIRVASRSSAARSAASTEVLAWREKPLTSAHRRRHDVLVWGLSSENVIGSCTASAWSSASSSSSTAAPRVATREQARDAADDANGELLDVLVGGRR